MNKKKNMIYSKKSIKNYSKKNKEKRFIPKRVRKKKDLFQKEEEEKKRLILKK